MHRGDREAQRENQITKRIIGFAMAAYRALGRGLVESAHEEYLWYELTRQGIPCSRQLPLFFRYKGVMLDCGDRMDLLAGDLVMAELKAVEDLSAIYEAQLLAYLRLGGKRAGLLGDFNVRVPQARAKAYGQPVCGFPTSARLCREISDAPALP